MYLTGRIYKKPEHRMTLEEILFQMRTGNPGEIFRRHLGAGVRYLDALIRDSQSEAIGNSRGGKTTKIHLAVDSGGLPIHSEISGGQVNAIVYGISGKAIVAADKGYASETLREFIRCKGAKPVIPRRGSNKTGNHNIDCSMYHLRYLVENVFLKIKKYRAISTRYDKLARNYQALV